MDNAGEKVPYRMNSRNVFLVGGITHVPESELKDHIGLFGQISMLLQYRYGLNPMFALRDNEIFLKELPREQRKWECYRIDQDCVDHSGFLVAELSVPSTGTGQELERAYINGIRTLALAKEEIRKEVTPDVGYFSESMAGEVKPEVIQKAEGGVSLITAGNRTIIHPIIFYANNGRIGRTNALRELDSRLQQEFSLTPITHKIDRAVQTDLELLKELDAGRTPQVLKGRDIQRERGMIDERIVLNRKRIDMAEALLTFDPENLDPRDYEKAFPFQKRLPLTSLEMGLTEPAIREIRIARERPNR